MNDSLFGFFFWLQNPKFSDFVDKQTGYKTKCMLTFPLMADKECLGVVMVLNKIGADAFSAEDEKVNIDAYSHFGLIRSGSEGAVSLRSAVRSEEKKNVLRLIWIVALLLVWKQLIYFF